jgi:hypothetical protein
MVNVCPAHIDPLLTEITGIAFTVTLDTAAADETHPRLLVPVTEKLLVEAGITVFEPFEKV